MSFLAPLFLLGLAALAIPVLIHLTRHERGRPIRFPSLMFLERIPFQETSRRKIRHWLLLSLRLAALALLVAAFARPFVRTGRLAAVGGLGPEEVVILLDQSYSMSLDGVWADAVAGAESAVAALGPLDRVSLIGFSETPHLMVRSSTDHQRAVSALDTLSAGSLATRIAPAVKLAATTLAASTLSRHRVVVVSDFQRTGWRADEDAKLAEGTVVETVVVGDETAENLALSDLVLDRASSAGRDRVTVEARLVNPTGSAVESTATLLIDQTEVQTIPLSVDAGGAEQISFAPFTLTQAFTQGEVAVTDNGLAADNTLSFIATPGGDVSVLLVDPSGAAESNLYIRRALGIAEGAGFQAQIIRGAPDAAQLNGSDVVILNGAPYPGGEGGNRLRTFVEEGGGLLMVLGSGSRVPADQADLLPVTIGEVVDAGREGRRLGFLDYDHAVFEAFRGARSGDFSRTAFYRHRSLTAAEGIRVLARFDDGSVALAEKRVGKGRVMVWASGLDRLWNNFPLQPVYLPFVHELTTYLGGGGEVAAWHEAGTTVDVVALADAAGGLELPDDAVAIDPAGGSVTIDFSDALLRLSTHGVWEIRSPGRRPDHPFALAANVDLAESDLTKLDLDEFRGSIGAGAAYEEDSGEGAVEAQAEDFEKRQSFWRYLLVLAFLFLAAETMLANWLSRHAVKQETGGASAG